MCDECQKHPHSRAKHASMNNWNYMEYIPVVPHYLINNYEKVCYNLYDIWSRLLVPSDFGPRKLNIVLTQFRCSATFLSYDLFKVNIISNPSCSCGAIREDSYHYFFECPLYNGIRNDLLNCLDWLPNDCHLDLNLLIFGNSTLTNEQNELVLKKVFDYIRKSERFLIVQCTFK